MENLGIYQDKLNRWSSHSRIAEMINDLPKGAQILDVGISTGIIARLCAGRDYTLHGIEPNTSWLGDARTLYANIFEGTLEQAPDAFLAGHNAVVCGDVLEHLVHPEVQLKRLVMGQQAGCLFIISVPNVANLWIRLNLLFGRFEYADRGILDRTHLHFYTRRTFLSLIQASGLQLQEIRATPIPLDLVFPLFNKNKIGQSLFDLLAWFTELWPTMFGYQWIAKATMLKQN